MTSSNNYLSAQSTGTDQVIKEKVTRCAERAITKETLSKGSRSCLDLWVELLAISVALFTVVL